MKKIITFLLIAAIALCTLISCAGPDISVPDTDSGVSNAPSGTASGSGSDGSEYNDESVDVYYNYLNNELIPELGLFKDGQKGEFNYAEDGAQPWLDAEGIVYSERVPVPGTKMMYLVVFHMNRYEDKSKGVYFEPAVSIYNIEDPDDEVECVYSDSFKDSYENPFLLYENEMNDVNFSVRSVRTEDSVLFVAEAFSQTPKYDKNVLNINNIWFYELTNDGFYPVSGAHLATSASGQYCAYFDLTAKDTEPVKDGVDKETFFDGAALYDDFETRYLISECLDDFRQGRDLKIRNDLKGLFDRNDVFGSYTVLSDKNDVSLLFSLQIRNDYDKKDPDGNKARYTAELTVSPNNYLDYFGN